MTEINQSRQPAGLVTVKEEQIAVTPSDLGKRVRGDDTPVNQGSSQKTSFTSYTNDAPPEYDDEIGTPHGGGSGMSLEDPRTGRRKIEIRYIDDKSRRHITFSKRKAGIMKKAYELSTLTGTQVLLLVASETGHVYTFATPKLQPLITKQEGKNLIQTCLNAPDPNSTEYVCALLSKIFNPPSFSMYRVTRGITKMAIRSNNKYMKSPLKPQ